MSVPLNPRDVQIKTIIASLTWALLLLTGAAGADVSRDKKERKLPVGPVAPPPPTDDQKRLDRFGDPLPPGAIARLGTIRRRFDALTMAWTGEGRTIIACNRERLFRWWDARTGELVKSQERPREP